MGRDAVDPLPLAQGAFGRIVEKHAFVVGDRTPVLHRAHRSPGQGELIELWQGVAHAEVAVEIAHDLLRRGHREARLFRLPLGGVNAELNAVDAVFELVHLADEEGDEISRHRHRAGERDFLLAPRERRGGRRRHIGDRGQRRVHHRAYVEGRAERRLVPRRKELARVHRLHLRREHDLLDEAPLLAQLVAQLIKPLGVPADPAGVVDLQAIVAGRDEAARGGQRRRFALGVEARAKIDLLSGARAQPRGCEAQVGGIENDRRDRLPDLDVDDRPAFEAIVAGGGHDAQRIVPGHDVLRQLSGGRDRARLCMRRRGKQRRDENKRPAEGFSHGCW